jgi:transposase
MKVQDIIEMAEQMMAAKWAPAEPQKGKVPLMVNRAVMALVYFQSADADWTRELVAAFGKEAGQARYEARGKGAEGTALRLTHDARELARLAWDMEKAIAAYVEFKTQLTPSPATQN